MQSFAPPAVPALAVLTAPVSALTPAATAAFTPATTPFSSMLPLHAQTLAHPSPLPPPPPPPMGPTAGVGASDPSAAEAGAPVARNWLTAERHAPPKKRQYHPPSSASSARMLAATSTTGPFEHEHKSAVRPTSIASAASAASAAPFHFEESKQHPHPQPAPAQPPARYFSPAAAAAAGIKPRMATASMAPLRGPLAPPPARQTSPSKAARAPGPPIVPSRFRVDSEDTATCCICESGESTEENQILLCDGLCSLAYHQDCLVQDTTQLPEGDWFCSPACDGAVTAVAAIDAACAAASASSAAAAAAATLPTSAVTHSMTDVQLGIHIARMRIAAKPKRDAIEAQKRAARLARLEQKQQQVAAAAAVVAPSRNNQPSTAVAAKTPAVSVETSREGMYKAQTADEFWTSLNAFFNHERLFNSQRLITPHNFDLSMRWSPDLGPYYKHAWTVEDNENDIPMTTQRRGYMRPARGTEKHDDFEFTHYYLEEEPNVGDPLAPVVAAAASPASTTLAASTVATAATAAPADASASPTTVAAAAVLTPPPSAPLLKLRSRHQSQLLKRVHQPPIRLTAQFSFNPPQPTGAPAAAAAAVAPAASLTLDSVTIVNASTASAAATASSASPAAASAAIDLTSDLPPPIVTDPSLAASAAAAAATASASDELLPPIATPPPPYFVLRALDRHYAREIGALDTEANPLVPPVAYRFSNSALKRYLSRQDPTIGAGASKNNRSVKRASIEHECEDFADVIGPMAGHYLWPQLLPTAPGDITEADAADLYFSIPPSLFSYKLRLKQNGSAVRLEQHDPLAVNRPKTETGRVESADDYAAIDGDEVSSALWLCRRELMVQVHTNNERRIALRQKCTEAGVFDKQALAERQKQASEERAVLAHYRTCFPSSYEPAAEYEQDQSMLEIQEAARRAGKSIATARTGAAPRPTPAVVVDGEGGRMVPGSAMSHVSTLQRDELRRERQREQKRLSRQRKRERDAQQKRDEDESPDDSDEDLAVSPRKQAPVREIVGGKAPRSSAAPKNDGLHGRTHNIIVIPRPKQSVAALRQQHEQVRSVLDRIVTMVEELDRSASIVKSKSLKIQQLRERKIKRQNDLAEWEDERHFRDPAKMVLDAIVAQIEINAAKDDEQVKSETTAAESSEATDAPTPMDVDVEVQVKNLVSLDEAEVKKEELNKYEVKNESPTVDAREPIGVAASSLALAAAASTSAARSTNFASIETAAASPPTRLPAAHLYVEPQYCPNPHPVAQRGYSANLCFVRCDECGVWWHLKCMGFITEDDLVRVYRAYCKQCQARGFENVNIAHGARRKRSKMTDAAGLPDWSAVSKHDAAMAMHLHDLDDAARLEKEEEDEERQLRHLYLAERHQQVVLIDEEGPRIKSRNKPLPPAKSNSNSIDEDEIAVMNDPTPWEWPTVRFKRLLSCRVKLGKKQTTRRSGTEYELRQPPIIQDTYFPMNRQGLQQFARAKFTLSIPTRIKKKMENRGKYYVKERVYARGRLARAESPAVADASAASSSSFSSSLLTVSPSRRTVGVSRSGRKTTRPNLASIRQLNFSDRDRSRSRMRNHVEEEEEEADESHSEDDAESSATDSDHAPPSAPTPKLELNTMKPLPVFEPTDLVHVTATRARTHSTRIKLRMRVKKALLPSETQQALRNARGARTSQSLGTGPVRALVESSESDADEDTLFVRGCIMCGSICQNDRSVLICDACDGEVHMACLQPPLKRVPKGDFHCPECLTQTLYCMRNGLSSANPRWQRTDLDDAMASTLDRVRNNSELELLLFTPDPDEEEQATPTPAPTSTLSKRANKPARTTRSTPSPALVEPDAPPAMDTAAPEPPTVIATAAANRKRGRPPTRARASSSSPSPLAAATTATTGAPAANAPATDAPVPDAPNLIRDSPSIDASSVVTSNAVASSPTSTAASPSLAPDTILAAACAADILASPSDTDIPMSDVTSEPAPMIATSTVETHATSELSDAPLSDLTFSALSDVSAASSESAATTESDETHPKPSPPRSRSRAQSRVRAEKPTRTQPSRGTRASMPNAPATATTDTPASATASPRPSPRKKHKSEAPAPSATSEVTVVPAVPSNATPPASPAKKRKQDSSPPPPSTSPTSASSARTSSRAAAAEANKRRKYNHIIQMSEKQQLALLLSHEPTNGEETERD